MGCSSDGNSGKFTVTLQTRVLDDSVSTTYNVQYSGSDEMSDCEIQLTEN